ncbi:histone deacetylase [Candidatus Fermentibacteria bacterium]|nr:histone deacetylase [Candidatus Fermentibacteria bacterium]
MGVVRDERYLLHDAGPAHPESPRRLEDLYACLDDPEVAGLVRTIPPRLASEEELLWNHTPEHVGRVRDACARGPRRLDPDTGVSPGSWEAALLAVGGVFAGLDALARREADVCIALVRPPGHHAEADRSMGFCLFNNVALGAHYARRVLGCGRIMIVDWDLHHGNGTQQSFYADPDVLFASIHQFPFYPGTGPLGETGTNAGEGHTVNVPLAAGAGDEAYAAAFNRVIVPVGLSYRPDLLLVSVGFDTHWDDPLGGMRVSLDGFAYMTRRLLELAAVCCGGRMLFCLEGGYSPRGQQEGLLAMLGECAGRSIARPEAMAGLTEAHHPAIDLIAEFHRRHWPVIEG